ncbi:MAG: ParA family protein [Acidobacteria bacterium]|nr:ParA family protein [Acidobacteriota bacterium]
MKKTRKIAVMNHKGGSGKSTTAVSVGHFLSDFGNKVALIDCDPQGNISSLVGLKLDRDTTATLYDILISDFPIEGVKQKVRQGFDIIPSNKKLAMAEMQMHALPAREWTLERQLSNFADDYDFVLLDCGPSLSLMVQNVLCYADELLIPCAADTLSVQGVAHAFESIEHTEKFFRRHPLILGIVPTFQNAVTSVAKVVVDYLKETYQDLVLPEVRLDTKVTRAAAQGETILEYSPKSRAAEDYRQLASKIAQISAKEVLLGVAQTVSR